jgi:hypothetical protein
VLDQLSDTDSMLEPRSTAQSGGVAGSARHLAPEELEAYANGRLASARLDHCRIHLDSCDACRAELEDLRIFKSELSGFQRSEPGRRDLGQSKRRRGLTLPQAVSVATIVVVAGAAIFWWEHRNHWGSKTSAAVSVAQSPVQTRDAQVANQLAALPVDVHSTVSDAVQHGTSQLQTDATRLRGRALLPSGAPEANTGFALLGPYGEAISETRPEFSWQPLPGAIRYSVVIVDMGLHPVQRSPSLRTTVWRPRRPLRRGRTYLWQVTATLRGGSKVVASEPSVSETLVRIVPLKPADEMPRQSP